MDDSSIERKQLVDDLLERGIRDARVLRAMGRVPRELFVHADIRHLAYDDRALPIDSGQTISQPYIVALMSEALELSGVETVLEIGTGSGYQAAILSQLARRVFSIERHADLASAAMLRLARLQIENVQVLTGDGTLGWPDEAPYDRVIATAAGDHVPPALFAQLVEGGVLVLPVGGLDEQVLRVVRKIDGRAVSRDLCGVRFVRLIGEEGWRE
jgi:protein-L-isoaspartate(D-aspartate) O-methyltransferase